MIKRHHFKILVIFTGLVNFYIEQIGKVPHCFQTFQTWLINKNTLFDSICQIVFMFFYVQILVFWI